MAKRKTCPNRWVNKEVVREVRNHGEAYWGLLTDAKTKKATMNRAFLRELRCHGLKTDVRRQSGYKPEIYLKPIKNRKVRHPY